MVKFTHVSFDREEEAYYTDLFKPIYSKIEHAIGYKK